MLKQEGGAITITILSPVTVEEKIKKKNDVKARSMLLVALPNEHLMTFNQYKDAKSLFAATETIFGGNEARKKTHKTFLKQMYENFSAPSTESLDSILTGFRRLNKPDLDTMSIVDLYNNFKIVEQELVHKDFKQIHKDDLEEMDLKWQLALLSMRAKRFFQKTRKKITINGSDTAGFDKSKDNACEKTPPKAMVATDEVGFDWSYIAEDEVPINMALMAFSDSKGGVHIQRLICPTLKQPQFESYGPMSSETESKNASEDFPNELKE
nr:ribonuclease H-like domain-containing protein [Tanacetum cinerariifolium]